LIRRLQPGYHPIGVLHSNEDTKPKIRYCSRCEEGYGLLSKLGSKILGIGESRPADYDHWVQCHNCGQVYAKHEVKIEPELSPIKEPSDGKQAKSQGIANKNAEITPKFLDVFKEIPTSAGRQYTLLTLVTQLPERVQDKAQETELSNRKAELLTHKELRGSYVRAAMAARPDQISTKLTSAFKGYIHRGYVQLSCNRVNKAWLRSGGYTNKGRPKHTFHAQKSENVASEPLTQQEKEYVKSHEDEVNRDQRVVDRRG
jgi:hypothetical protein